MQIKSIIQLIIKVMQEYTYLHKDYYLQLIEKQEGTSISVFDYKDLQKVEKYGALIRFNAEEPQPCARYFDSYDQLVRFMSHEGNYQVSLQNQRICLKWKFVGINYEKQKFIQIDISPFLLNQNESLMIKSIILQKKNRQNMFANKDASKQARNFTNKKEVTFKKKKNTKGKSVNHRNFKNKQQSSSQNFEINSSGNKPRKNCQKKTKGIEKNDQKRNSKDKYKKKPKKQTEQPQQISVTPVQISPNKFRCDYDNGDYYIGSIKDNNYDGQGFYFSKQNGTYEGSWKNGKAEGYGISTDKIGNILKGFFKQDKRFGDGVDIYENGQTYQGNFYAEAKNGWGRYTYKDQSYYQGYWKNNQYHGKGKQYLIHESTYLGEWKVSQKHGQGILCKQGQILRQKWKNGVLIQSSQINKRQKEKFQAQFNLKPPQ